MRSLAALLLIAAPAWAESPSATTATYGNWTLGCQTAGGAEAAAGKACQIVTRLNLKGQDGQLRPLLAVVLAQQAGGTVLRIETPGAVDLRQPVQIEPAAEAGKPLPAGDPLARLDWLTCDGGTCVAGSDATGDLVDRLQGVAAVDVSFTLYRGGKVIRVPVSLAGFGDAVKALKAAE